MIIASDSARWRPAHPPCVICGTTRGIYGTPRGTGGTTQVGITHESRGVLNEGLIVLKYAACVARRLRLYAMSVRCHAVSIHTYICLAFLSSSLRDASRIDATIIWWCATVELDDRLDAMTFAVAGSQSSDGCTGSVDRRAERVHRTAPRRPALLVGCAQSSLAHNPQSARSRSAVRCLSGTG